MCYYLLKKSTIIQILIKKFYYNVKSLLFKLKKNNRVNYYNVNRYIHIVKYVFR